MHFSANTLLPPSLHQFFAVVKILHFFGAIGTNLHIILCYFSIKIIDAETALSNGAIWDEFSEQHQHQSIKKHPMSTLLMQKRCTFLHFLVWQRI